MRVLIIGGGAAGVTAATRLRRLDENAEIIILEQGDALSVSNCGLLYYLGGEVRERDELINTTPEKLKRQYNIDARLNAEVEFINRQEKTVTIKDKGKEYYDKLVFTIGAYQLRPDIDGVLAEQVFTIRDLASIERIKNYIKDFEPARAIIVGGGYIGVETAEVLHKLKIDTAIVEAADHILSGDFDNDIAAGIQNLLRGKGIKIYLNTKVEAFGDKSVSLSNGQKLDYDMAIIATGVKPDLKLSILSDLEVGEAGGLVVNEYMQTSDKDIYAAGDDVEVLHMITRKPVRLSQAGLAVKEARVIAEHLAGISHKFKYALNTSAAQIFGLTAAASGATETKLKAAGTEYEKIHLYAYSHAGYLPDNRLNLYKLLFDRKGRLLGIQALGNREAVRKTDVTATAIMTGVPANELEDLALCYAPPYGNASDAVNTLGTMAENVLNGRVKFISPFSGEWGQMAAEAMIIDVRPPEMFEKGHLPHAINIPQTAIRNNLSSIPQDKPVVLYCNRSIRAYVAAALLNNRGFDNIYVLSGGLYLYNEIEQNLREQNQTEAEY